MVVEIDGLTGFLSDNLSTLPSRIMAGDVFAVSILLISVYIAVLIINKLTGLIIFLLKKLFLLTIITLAFYQFLMSLALRISEEGFTQDLMIFGAAGTVLGFLAIIIALHGAFNSFKSLGLTVSSKIPEGLSTKEGEPAEGQLPTPANPVKNDGTVGGIFSLDTLKDDKSIGAVLTYMVIAEFGVFSSKTIPAPTANVGLGFFIVFLLAAFIFIRQSYQEYRKGLSHFAIALVFGGVLSIILGHFWGNYSLEQLLSIGYFATDSLVAIVTGLSLSLFMSNKG
jgi:hypothetical protein